MTWSFQHDRCEADLNIIEEDSYLSLARQSARESFIAIRDGLGWEETSDECEALETHPPTTEEPPRLHAFEGTSYRLVIRTMN